MFDVSPVAIWSDGDDEGFREGEVEDWVGLYCC